MMKRIVGVLLATLAGATASLADGPPSRAQVLAPVAAPMTWTGFYLGVHAGHGWAHSQTVVADGNATFPLGYTSTARQQGMLAGGQVGYNYQMGALVVGVEGDLATSNVDGSGNLASPLIANRDTDTYTRMNWLGTATGRIGFAQGNTLFYVKGGWAWSEFSNHSDTRTGVNGAATISVGNSDRDGWLLGGGLEYMINRNWSVKAEYNYIDFGTERELRTTVFGTTAGTINLRDVERDLHIAKLGVNYKF